jgi:integrase
MQTKLDAFAGRKWATEVPLSSSIKSARPRCYRARKLPENFRAESVLFSEIADNALAWAKTHKLSYGDDVIRMKRILEAFKSRPAESISSQDIEKWFAEQTWKPATFNRYKALFSLVYRLAISAGKVKVNPARAVKTRTENNGRTRFLSKEEETRLRQQIAEHCPEHLPEFDIALYTGMRRSEQYGLTWGCVDLERRILTIPRSKHGWMRYVFLNDTSLAALQMLWKFPNGTGRVFSSGCTSKSKLT